MHRSFVLFFSHSFDVLEGGLWESYAVALVYDLHVVLSGLHEKWVVMGQDLGACHMLTPLSPDPQNQCRLSGPGVTEARSLTPF